MVRVFTDSWAWGFCRSGRCHGSQSASKKSDHREKTSSNSATYTLQGFFVKISRAGALFLLGSSEISGIKPLPSASGAFRKNPVYIMEGSQNTRVFRENLKEGGAFFCC